MSSQMKHAVVPVVAVVALGGLFGFWASRYVEAASSNFTMNCSVANSTLTLNPFDPLTGTVITAPTGTITVSCTSTANQSVTVNYTLQVDASTSRQLANGASVLAYDLYTDPPTSTTKWGTTGTCVAGSATNQGNVLCGSYSVAKNSTTTNNKNFYAKVPTTTATDVPIGTYQQTLNVTLTYSCNPAPSSGC